MGVRGIPAAGGLLARHVTDDWSLRGDQGYRQQVEGYLAKRGVAQFTHGICPSCEERVLADDALRETMCEAMGEVMRDKNKRWS